MSRCHKPMKYLRAQEDFTPSKDSSDISETPGVPGSEGLPTTQNLPLLLTILKGHTLCRLQPEALMLLPPGNSGVSDAGSPLPLHPKHRTQHLKPPEHNQDPSTLPLEQAVHGRELCLLVPTSV